MPVAGEHKTVQARILKYAQEIGWTYVPRAEAERRRGFDPDGATPEERARKASLYFGDLLHTQIRAFNPKYKEAEGALIGQFQRFHADIYGNRDFLQALRNQHKFFCAEENRELDLNLRRNIFVLIDEAHRTTGGDLGNFLMAGLPNATFIGFTGTPVDKTAYGKGTFKTFGCEDDKGYLHKYSISESIEDGTTLPLYYNLAPNEMLVPHEIMEKEFFALAETGGIADIEELNKILERAVNLKNFLKGKDRVKKVARHVADHFRANVEPQAGTSRARRLGPSCSATSANAGSGLRSGLTRGICPESRVDRPSPRDPALKARSRQARMSGSSCRESKAI